MSAQTLPTMLEGHEQVVLAAMMNGHSDLPVSEADFASPTHRTIFQSIKRSKVKGLLAVQAHLGRRRKLVEVGGPARLTEISCLPTDEANVQFALSEVLGASRKRRATDIGARLNRGAITFDQAIAELNALKAKTLREPERPLIEFRSPLQLKDFEPPAGIVLAGDYHIVKGNTFVIGGAPGIGKSLSTVALAVAGATQSDWFGYKVHRKFKVLIVQNGISPN